MDDEEDESPDLSEDLTLNITGVEAEPEASGEYRVRIHTDRGDVRCLFAACEGEPGAAVLLGGALGGFDGPADGLYGRLAERLVEGGVSCLRVHYREPGEFSECVLDALAALSFIKGIGGGRVVLVGHSFGGAVVIKAGELSPAVTAVAALSSQRYGTSTVENLAPRPLLLVHGSEDTVLLPAASQDIFDRAGDPKRLMLLEGAGHALMEYRDELTAVVEEFVLAMAGRADYGAAD